MIPHVSLSRVTKQYDSHGETTALRELSMTVSAGEMLLLFGPSGSGKTTLLQIMGGVVSPTSGECRLFGQRLEDLPDRERQEWRARRLGFVFQNFRLLDALTAVENVMLAAQFAGRTPGDARSAAMTALETVGLGAKADRRPHALSHGEQQRVAVARAIVNRAPLILADEPTASLDAAHGASLLRWLRDFVHADGTSVVMASHDPRSIELADRVVYLRDGAVTATATIRVH